MTAGWLVILLQPARGQELAPPEAALAEAGVMDPSPVEPELADLEGFASSLDPAETLGAKRIRYLVSAGGEYQFDADIDNAGSFGVVRARAGAGAVLPLGDRLSLDVFGSYGIASYDFDDDPAFGGGEAWGDISTFQGVIAGRYRVTDEWSIAAGLIGATAAEDAADSSSFTGGGFVGAGYRASDKLMLSLGVSVVSQLEDDPLVVPTFVLNWSIDDHWQLRAGGFDTGATDLLGVGISYRLDAHWSLGGQVGYVMQRFRLDDSGLAPEGVGQEDRAKAALVLMWRDQPAIEASIVGGVAFAGQVRVEDDDGDRVFEEDYDPAPFLGARLALRF